MKSIVLFITLTFNFVYGQDLSFKTKRMLRKEVKIMVKSDQFYRLMMVKNPGFSNDSIWKLQTINDSINFSKFYTLTKKYGYLSCERIGRDCFGVLIHLTYKEHLDKLEVLMKNELLKKNISPRLYSIWHDRCHVNMKIKTMYGAYGQKIFCGDDLIEINSNRKQIGLEILQKDPSCN